MEKQLKITSVFIIAALLGANAIGAEMLTPPGMSETRPESSPNMPSAHQVNISVYSGLMADAIDAMHTYLGSRRTDLVDYVLSAFRKIIQDEAREIEDCDGLGAFGDRRFNDWQSPVISEGIVEIGVYLSGITISYDNEANMKIMRLFMVKLIAQGSLDDACKLLMQMVVIPEQRFFCAEAACKVLAAAPDPPRAQELADKLKNVGCMIADHACGAASRPLSAEDITALEQLCAALAGQDCEKQAGAILGYLAYLEDFWEMTSYDHEAIFERIEAEKMVDPAAIKRMQDSCYTFFAALIHQRALNAAAAYAVGHSQ